MKHLNCVFILILFVDHFSLRSVFLIMAVLICHLSESLEYWSNGDKDNFWQCPSYKIEQKFNFHILKDKFGKHYKKSI